MMKIRGAPLLVIATFLIVLIYIGYNVFKLTTSIEEDEDWAIDEVDREEPPDSGFPSQRYTPLDPPDEPDPVTPTSSITIVGTQLYDANGEPLLLVGFQRSLGYSVENVLLPKNTNEAMFSILSEEGGNFVSLALNSELWGNDPRQDEYRDLVDKCIKWCKKYNLYYILKLQEVGDGSLNKNYPKGKYCRAGYNWQLTDPNYEKTGSDGNLYPSKPFNDRAMQMWENLATLYGDDPNNVGYGLLNEPYSGKDFSKWDNVINYYLECIDLIRGIDSNPIFFVMEPYSWGGYTMNWRNQGYLDSYYPEGEAPMVVYEFHNYYHHMWDWNYNGEPDTGRYPNASWGAPYAMGEFEAGWEDLTKQYTYRILPAQEDGYPLYCGEYAILSTPEDPWRDGDSVPNHERAVGDQMDWMHLYGIHTTYHQMAGYQFSSPYRLATSSGTELNSRGRIWAAHIPNNLIRP